MARPGTVCLHNNTIWVGLGGPVPGTRLKMAGTGTPSYMMGVPGWACAQAGWAQGTDMARPGQSLLWATFERFPAISAVGVRQLIAEEGSFRVNIFRATVTLRVTASPLRALIHDI
jgi:hypothetical protein